MAIQFSIFKELLFVYNYFEYLWRYLFVIYPKLRKNKLVIADRYFYDIYGQYSYSKVSKLVNFLFKLYPKPDFLFVLDAKLDSILKRDKNIKLFSNNVKRSNQRVVHETQYLADQKKRYLFLKEKLNGILIATEKQIDKNINLIIKESWYKYRK